MEKKGYKKIFLQLAYKLNIKSLFLVLFIPNSYKNLYLEKNVIDYGKC